MESRPPRVLVFGSAPHGRSVHAYKWDRLPPELNVADYDVLILNLVPFQYEMPDVAWNNLIKVTNNQWEPLARLLFSANSEILVIGQPVVQKKHGVTVAVDNWLPFKPEINFGSGQEMREIVEPFNYYFRHVRTWNFYATNEFVEGVGVTKYLKVVCPRATHLTAHLIPLAQTRFQRPVAFQIEFRAYYLSSSITTDYSRWQLTAYFDYLEDQHMDPVLYSGDVIWLAPPTEISDREAVNLVLQERYGIVFEEALPDWAPLFKLPAELPIEKQIDQINSQLSDLMQALEAQQQRLAHKGRFRKLLYEGDAALEPVVHEALRELGAQVEEPERAGHEDGRATDASGRNYMLEVKGRTGTLQLKDVRQLHQWVEDAIHEDDWESKGLLIANLHREIAPGHRVDPFPDNCIRAAERYGYCLMTTTQLYRALADHQRGELDLNEFWDTTYKTSGVCPLPELEPVEVVEEAEEL
jgi:hypothetical protein